MNQVSQEIESTQQISLSDILLDMLSYQLNKFFGTLKHTRHLHGVRPVWPVWPVAVVETLFIGELSQLFLRHLRRVMDHHVMDWPASPIFYFMSNQMKVISLVFCQVFKDNSACTRLVNLRHLYVWLTRAIFSLEIIYPSVCLCVYVYIHDFGSIVRHLDLVPYLFNCGIKGVDLWLDSSLKLLHAESLSVDQDQSRPLFVG